MITFDHDNVLTIWQWWLFDNMITFCPWLLFFTNNYFSATGKKTHKQQNKQQKLQKSRSLGMSVDDFNAYREQYRSFRVGHAKGSKGELSQFTTQSSLFSKKYGSFFLNFCLEVTDHDFYLDHDGFFLTNDFFAFVDQPLPPRPHRRRPQCPTRRPRYLCLTSACFNAQWCTCCICLCTSGFFPLRPWVPLLNLRCCLFAWTIETTCTSTVTNRATFTTCC